METQLPHGEFILRMVDSGILSTLFLSVLYWLFVMTHGNDLFKAGRNPAHRICKLCGQHQIEYTRSYDNSFTWWEDVYPLGNNEKCPCHKYSTYYSY